MQETVSTCRAALYVRLSVEDSHTHSASIETQQMIIAQFLERNPDIQVYDTYIDNGTSGTTFHRPAFQKMLLNTGITMAVLYLRFCNPFRSRNKEILLYRGRACIFTAYDYGICADKWGLHTRNHRQF